MKRNLIIFCSIILIATLAVSCVKVIPKFNSNTIAVTFNAPTAVYLTANKTVNVKDSLDFSYSVSCPTPMTNVTLVKNGTAIYSDSVKTSDRLTFAGVKKFLADSAAGQYVYQVVARDNDGIYLGASAPIVVTVTPDFMYFVGRRLYVPDSTSKTNPCFINLATGTTYSYSDVTAAGNSAQIDLGFFFSTDTVNTATSGSTITKSVVGPTFYAPSSTPVAGQRAVNDLSTWTKSATLLNDIYSGATFANLISGGGLNVYGANAIKTSFGSVPNYNLYPATQASATYKLIQTGSLIYFKTVAGKYGVINVTYISATNASHGTYINFDYKIHL